MAKAGEHLIKPCVICGEQYRQSRSDQMYCSGRCASIAWRERHHVQQIKQCAVCGADFDASERRRYCATECFAEAEHRRKQAQASGEGKGWSAGKKYVPRRVCELCGTEFYAPPILIRRGGGRFCSKACYGKHIATHPELFPVTSRRSRMGKRADLGGLFVRSSWEANWARYLNWLVEQDEVRQWEYEPETFEFHGIKRGSRFYTPDFRVTNRDGSVEYHEVKGYMDAVSATKLKRMAKYYPEVRVVLVEKDTYCDMARKVGRMLPEWEGSYS